MKVAIGKVLNSLPALSELASADMPPALALRLKRIGVAAGKEMESFSAIEREAADKFGGSLVQKDGVSFFQFEDVEKSKDYMAAINEARAVEIDVPGEPFTEDEFNRIGKVTPKAVMALDWLFPF